MKPRVGNGTVCRVILGCQLLLYASAALHASDKATDVVLAADRERADAQIKQDVPTLERVLSDDLTYIHASGLVQTKADFLADLKSGKRVYKSIKNSDVNVRLLENAAVITARSEITVAFEGKENELSVQVTEVYAKRGGRWQLIAYQSTRTKP